MKFIALKLKASRDDCKFKHARLQKNKDFSVQQFYNLKLHKNSFFKQHLKIWKTARFNLTYTRKNTFQHKTADVETTDFKPWFAKDGPSNEFWVCSLFSQKNLNWAGENRGPNDLLEQRQRSEQL